MTRQEYLAANNAATTNEQHWELFQAYYGQFVTGGLKQAVLRAFGTNQLREAIATDRHINNIPLAKWDQLAQAYRTTINTQLHTQGDYWSNAGGVCVLKEAARQAIQQE
jgi:hypothetical protein